MKATQPLENLVSNKRSRAWQGTAEYHAAIHSRAVIPFSQLCKDIHTAKNKAISLLLSQLSAKDYSQHCWQKDSCEHALLCTGPSLLGMLDSQVR